MIITLTHDLNVQLLEAIKRGELDTSIFDEQQSESRTLAEIEAEIVRLEDTDKYDGTMLKLSELMRRYALNEISREEYVQERLKLYSKTWKRQ